MLFNNILSGLFTLFLVNMPWIFAQSPEDLCQIELDALAESVSNFTRCAVNKASPFRFCRLCYNEFDTVRAIKSLIYDKHYDCVRELVESERYQIVKRVYDFANTLWEGSFCYNCFKSNNKDNIGDPWIFKDGVVEFFNKQTVVNNCFRNHTEIESHSFSNYTSNITMTNITNTHIVCSKCKKQYDDVNDAYYQLIKNMGGYAKENVLCADVVSAMNTTRQRWSHQFNCVAVSLDTVSVVALTVLFCFFPIIFYSAAKLHGDYTEKKTNIHIPQIDYNSAD